MKILLLIAFIIFVIAFTPVFTCVGGCADEKTLCKGEICKTYPPCGLFEDDCKDPAVRYTVVTGNVVAGIIFVATIYLPVVLGGWFLWEPVEYK